MPAGVALDIRPESRGLLTRTEYADTPLGNEILELVRMGALRSQSFTGGIIRSDPSLRGPGDKYRRGVSGMLQRVRRLTLGLREYGLTPFPAYSGAEVCGVRMDPLDGGHNDGGEEVTSFTEDELAGYTPEEVDPPDSPGHRLYVLRAEEAYAAAGIEFRTPRED
jgi:hypothetical protein